MSFSISGFGNFTGISLPDLGWHTPQNQKIYMGDFVIISCFMPLVWWFVVCLSNAGTYEDRPYSSCRDLAYDAALTPMIDVDRLDTR